MHRLSCLTSQPLACAVAGTLWSLALVGHATPVALVAQVSAEQVTINDNRRAAGSLVADTLTIRLEARLGEWRPDGDDGLAVKVKAFAVENGPLQVPGPLIRVHEGTQIRASIRNRLEESLAIHGLYARPGKPDEATIIPPGETRDFTFPAGSPGTYYYWAAADAKTPLAQRLGRDTQLSGALVVDPHGAARDADRVLMIANWINDVPVGKPGRANRFVINGRSWPHTERLAYRVGDTVRMRLINAGAAVHPMHLHGFYFNVDSRGNEAENTVYPAGSSPHLVVTERLTPGLTFSLTWKPTRPGNWLFHCHDNVHLDYGGALDGTPAPPRTHRHVQNHTLEMMAGPVMGITVTGESLEVVPAAAANRRQIRLVARVDTGGTTEDPAFGYTLDDASGRVPPPPYLPGPTLLLKRGEPVSITVANELPEPTSVHWHGIELESYYDGVPDYAGDSHRTARAIEPGGAFEARFTPPRSGTFIYHTHFDDTRQQRAGLSGALVVVDDPATFDPSCDLVMLVTVPRKTADNGVVLLNGSSTPARRELRVGERYRLRFINVHTFRPSMRMRLLQDTTLQRWRSLAKDGMDLPTDRKLEGPSEIQMGNGETYDFEYVPSAPGDFKLDVTAANGTLLVTMPIRVSLR